MDCATLSVPEAAKLLGIGRVRMYEAVREGRVRALRADTKPKYRIPRRAIERLPHNPRRFERRAKR
jgi:excisionase family DNA binding protein